MATTDRAIVARWTARLGIRLGLERAAKARHTAAQRALTKARADDVHPRGELVRARDAASDLLALRRKQVAEARRVIARHSAGLQRVSAPVEPIHGDKWGWTPAVPKAQGGGAVHDGIDVIADWKDEVCAMVDAVVVDVRASGWWGKGAAPSSGHPVSDGDGIIQLQVLRDVGPFKKGDIVGYGHTENATVRVGQTVRAGQVIGRIGWAKIGHIHLMWQRGLSWTGRPSGVGTMDPRPILDYAVKHDA